LVRSIVLCYQVSLSYRETSLLLDSDVVILIFGE